MHVRKTIKLSLIYVRGASMIVNIKRLTTTTTTLIAKIISMRMFSEMASSFYTCSTVSLVTEKLTNFKAAIYEEIKSLKHSLLLHQINKLI